MQQLVKSKFLRVLPVAGEFNEADIGTKCLPAHRHEFRRQLSNLKDTTWHNTADKGEGYRRSLCCAIKQETIAQQKAQAMMAKVIAESFPLSVSAGASSISCDTEMIAVQGQGT